MSTIYALACRNCLRKVDVSRTSARGPEPGFACVTHQQLINFLSEHVGCALVFEDSVEGPNMEDILQDDTNHYPDHPFKP